MTAPSQEILYISYDGMTDPLGQSQVLPYLIGLTQMGYHFTVLSCEKPERFEKYKSQIAQICAQSGITWVPLPYTKKPPVLSTIIDVIRLNKKSKEIYTATPYVLIHARGYIPSLIALGLKRKYNIKYLFDMRGFWADERIDGHIWSLKNPLFRTIYKFFKKREKEFLENADHVITLTDVAKEEIHSWKNIENNPVPITVIPCCADMNAFSMSRVDAPLREQLKQDIGLHSSDYIFLYLGSLGTWYMLDEMLDFFKVLISKKSNAKLLFVTNDNRDMILQAVERKNIDKAFVKIVNSPFDKVPAYISLADSSIFFIRPTFSKKGSSPVKQGELMSMGVPIVCNANVGDTELIVKKYHSGVVVDSFDTNSYTLAADDLMDTAFDKGQIIGGAEEYFSVSKGIEKYLEVYKKLLR